MPSLSDVPVEIFIDNIFPLLPVRDLLRFGATNRAFYLLTSDETFWKRKLEAEFNFPGSDTARITGWKFIYRRLSNPKVYVWGESSRRRLGMHPRQLPQTIVADGVPFPLLLRIPGVRVVNLVAGGMSFHALDSQGRVYVWGALDGTGIALNSDGFSEPCKTAESPLRLALPCSIRSISCARLFSAALDSQSRVWTFVSWGRPFVLQSPLLDKSGPDSTPVQVECGWTYTSILTESGDVLVYWPMKGRMLEYLHGINSALDEQSPQSKARISADHPDVIPCHTLQLEGVDPVRLPSIPSDLPVLPRIKSEDDEGIEGVKVVKLAGMDNNLIALTNKGHVLKYNRLGGEEEYRQGRWEYLPYFSELSKVREDDAFNVDEEVPLKRPSEMRITHISASFKTFFAYSTGSESLVLMGKMETETLVAPPILHNPPLKPIIIPALQYQSVISVVLGDYHYGALTSTGKLLTWGSFSKGALGLGDPMKIEAGKPGGFRTEEEKRRMLTAPHMLHTPAEVHVPTEVRFDHGEKKPRQRYCFAVTAAGWHMGALVIDLEPDEEADDEEEEALSMPGAFPATGTPPPPPQEPQGHAIPIIGHRGMLPFRIGFAGRGGRIAGGRGGPGPFGPAM